MKIVCISDTHCQLNNVKVPSGDLLIHAGDALSYGSLKEFMTFIKRYEDLPHEHKIYVPGNHDRITEDNEFLVKDECAKRGIIYLNDSGTEVEGLKIWGSGVSPRFGHNWAWNRDDDIQEHWDLIPEDTDILVTHAPPHGIMDVSIYSHTHCGCRRLLEKVYEVKPKLHIFGHIHSGYGVSEFDGIKFINASTCTEKYNPTNLPIVVELD